MAVILTVELLRIECTDEVSLVLLAPDTMALIPENEITRDMRL